MIRSFRNCQIYNLKIIFENAYKKSDFETLILEEIKNTKISKKYNKLKIKIKRYFNLCI